MIYNTAVESLKSLKSAINEVFVKNGKINNMLNATIILFVIFAMINLTGCCAYSFTGASVPEHLKTIAIPVSDDRSGSGEPGLRELFTDLLTQKFIDDNTLAVTQRGNANAILETTITSLVDAPAIVTAGEQIAKRRITVAVQVVYRDLVKRKTIYEKSFSFQADYLADGGIVGRQNAIQTAVDKIADDILLDTVSGW